MDKEFSRYERIKGLCKDNGITISALEKELGFSKGSISKIDKNKPSIDRLEKIAAYFDCPVDYFLRKDYYYINKRIDRNYDYYKKLESFLLAQEMFEDRDMRTLYHIKKNIDPEKFQAHIDMIKSLYRIEHPEDDMEGI